MKNQTMDGQKYIVLIVGLIIFLIGLVIDLTTRHAVHVPMSFFTIPITIVYLLLGWMYQITSSLQLKTYNENLLINLCILYTSIFPLLIIGGGIFLKVFLGIKVTQSSPSLFLSILFYIFIGVQAIGLGMLLILLRRRFLKK